MLKHGNQQGTWRLFAALTALVAFSGCELPSSEDLAALDAEQQVGSERQETVTACPLTMSDYATAQTITCSCSAEATAGGMWGTDAYTSDSSVCGAAVHAGRITTAGGTVTVTVTAYDNGRNNYVGSTRNGITSTAWGAYGRSFYFR
ncbi:MAG TPA: LCCL domain-containing protein [Archangium sp.]|nr:LCCL domain-containing protein [Archangium sp.]